MTVLTDTQVVTASGGLVELGYSQVAATVTITSNTAGSGTEIIAPLTVVCDGSPVLVEFWCGQMVLGGTGQISVSLYKDGSEVHRQWAVPYNAAAGAAYPSLYASYRTTPTAGSHTFGVKGYGPSSPQLLGAGTNNAPIFLRVSKIVTATQWPAVTTGTIICTSSTRPASPFAGQQIYETDTSREFTYVGTQWVPRDGIFTTEALRDAAITAPFEGQRAYITGSTVAAATGSLTNVPTGVQTIYNGTAWVCVTPVAAQSDTDATTTSTSYVTTLTGDATAISVTIATGTTALLSFESQPFNVLTAASTFLAFSVSGATTIAAADGTSSRNSAPGVNYGFVLSRNFVVRGLTAGTNTFTLNYKVGSGTATYRSRALTVTGIA